MTVNARNLELMLRRIAAIALDEAREYGRKLYAAVKDVAPSLIRYTEATAYDRLTKIELQEQAAAFAQKYGWIAAVKKNSCCRTCFCYGGCRYPGGRGSYFFRNRIALPAMSRRSRKTRTDGKEKVVLHRISTYEGA